MKQKTLGLVAFVSIFISACCWVARLLCDLINKIADKNIIGLGKLGEALLLIANICTIVVLLFAAYEWVKTKSKAWKIIYWIIAILSILSIIGISVLGFSL